LCARADCHQAVRLGRLVYAIVFNALDSYPSTACELFEKGTGSMHGLNDENYRANAAVRSFDVFSRPSYTTRSVLFILRIACCDQGRFLRAGLCEVNARSNPAKSLRQRGLHFCTLLPVGPSETATGCLSRDLGWF